MSTHERYVTALGVRWNARRVPWRRVGRIRKRDATRRALGPLTPSCDCVLALPATAIILSGNRVRQGRLHEARCTCFPGHLASEMLWACNSSSFASARFDLHACTRATSPDGLRRLVWHKTAGLPNRQFRRPCRDHRVHISVRRTETEDAHTIPVWHPRVFVLPRHGPRPPCRERASFPRHSRRCQQPSDGVYDRRRPCCLSWNSLEPSGHQDRSQPRSPCLSRYTAAPRSPCVSAGRGSLGTTTACASASSDACAVPPKSAFCTQPRCQHARDICCEQARPSPRVPAGLHTGLSRVFWHVPVLW
jgi:hypothetical protein